MITELGLEGLDQTIIDYMEMTNLTAVYPGTGTDKGQVYISMGLCGEAGEVCEKLKKAMRDHQGHIDGVAFVKELGDVCWYVAQMAVCANWIWNPGPDGDHAPVDGEVVEMTNEIKWQHILSAYNTWHTTDLPEVPGSVEELTEVARENVYDAATDPKRIDYNCLAQILMNVDIMARFVGSDLTKVMAANTAKLLDRKERGAIQGSGDAR